MPRNRGQIRVRVEVDYSLLVQKVVQEECQKEEG